uniref:G-protein coupled receptors family 1 profile domain-containing protein n=1 Tax=Peromyscus maniculatus bairdii TaxID=230844 RepID=A0A8C8UB18_PERMB
LRAVFSQITLQLCYENMNGSCIKALYSSGVRVILYMVFGFGAVLAVFGNPLVVISILHFKQLHSPANFLIASLASADFLVGISVMPFSMVRSIESYWYFGDTFCSLHSCWDAAFCYSSLFHLCFISIDRCIAVTDPLVYPTKFTVSVSGICISISWTLPLVYSSAVFYTGISAKGMESLVGGLNWVGGCQVVVNQDWILMSFLLFFIPTLVMIILYSKIFLLNIATKQNHLAFVISWLPYTMDTLIDAYMGFITPAYIYEICCWGAYYNSALNPLIYALFYPWFRKAIKLILSGEILKGHSSTTTLFSE